MTMACTTVTQEGGILRRGGQTFDPPILQRPADIDLGKKWRTAFNVSFADGSKSRNYWDFKVVTIENIDLPAGTIRAYKVEGEGEGSGSQGARNSSTFRITFWIDSATLIQVKSELKIWDFRRQLTEWYTTELVSMTRVPR
jgi:hypothetical protein